MFSAEYRSIGGPSNIEGVWVTISMHILCPPFYYWAESGLWMEGWFHITRFLLRKWRDSWYEGKCLGWRYWRSTLRSPFVKVLDWTWRRPTLSPISCTPSLSWWNFFFFALGGALPSSLSLVTAWDLPFSLPLSSSHFTLQSASASAGSYTRGGESRSRPRFLPHSPSFPP